MDDERPGQAVVQAAAWFCARRSPGTDATPARRSQPRSRISTIYRPLGAVFAFLALLYVASLLVLFGAELVVAARRPAPVEHAISS